MLSKIPNSAEGPMDSSRCTFWYFSVKRATCLRKSAGEDKRVVLQLILYEEQRAGDEQRWELGSSNLEESCFPGKVVCPWIMEKIRGNEEGGRDIFG